MSDAMIRRAEGLILIVVLVTYVLASVVGRLRRRRPDFHIGRPLIVGLDAEAGRRRRDQRHHVFRRSFAAGTRRRS